MFCLHIIANSFTSSLATEEDGFSGYVADRADPEDFIHALVVQQNEKSAPLLDTILNRLPLWACIPDMHNITNEVITEIWEHPCPAYARLREKIKAKAQDISKSQIQIPIDSSYEVPIDTTKEIIRW